MDHVRTQIYGQAFQTLGLAFKIPDRAFSFLLRLHKLSRASESLNRLLKKKYSTTSFAADNFLISSPQKHLMYIEILTD